jgi:hypothetical protein
MLSVTGTANSTPATSSYALQVALLLALVATLMEVFGCRYRIPS